MIDITFNFTNRGRPKTVDDYFKFIDEEFAFLKKRNNRIKAYIEKL